MLSNEQIQDNVVKVQSQMTHVSRPRRSMLPVVTIVFVFRNCEWVMSNLRARFARNFQVTKQATAKSQKMMSAAKEATDAMVSKTKKSQFRQNLLAKVVRTRYIRFRKKEANTHSVLILFFPWPIVRWNQAPFWRGRVFGARSWNQMDGGVVSGSSMFASCYLPTLYCVYKGCFSCVD